MGLGGFPGAFPFPGMMSNSMGMNGMAGLSSPTTSTNANTPTTTTTNNSSSRAADSEKKSSSKESKRASAKESSSSSSALASASAADKKDPLADNPFLAAMGMAGLANSNAGSSAGGIFGMNPFMAGGMQPGMSPNLALAQLQSLIGMQGLDSLMAASFPGFPAVSSVGQTQSTPSRKTTTTTSSSGGGGGGGGGSSSKAVADNKGGKEKSGRSTSSSNSRSAGSNSKLNALVDKLAAAKGESPAPAKHDDDNNDDEGRK
uniref:Uncharacterized protein n=1 Tax=Plectus sambesii TaxID=2011161 RepID=A0A914VIR0_9BILA